MADSKRITHAISVQELSHICAFKPPQGTCRGDTEALVKWSTGENRAFHSLRRDITQAIVRDGWSAIRKLPVLYSVSASGRNLLGQSLILHGPFAEQCDGFRELVAGWREAVVNMRGDNWMNQPVEQSALLQLL
jgi:hypothetical protein